MSTNSIQNQSMSAVFSRLKLQRGMVFGVIILFALISFEMFNFSTTQYALEDLLGNLSFLGISWATILAIAFCGIDFAGIARLHTPEEGSGQATETWYLFGAWLLAATMNAMLTWWGVSLALVNNASVGDVVIDHQTLLKIVPIFVAVLVWLIRMLIIGTYSLAGTRLLTQRDRRVGQPARGGASTEANGRVVSRPQTNSASLGNPVTASSPTFRSLSRPAAPVEPTNYTSRQEPVYTPLQSASQSRNTPANNENSYPSKSGLSKRS
jgi:hypothetical protein